MSNASIYRGIARVFWSGRSQVVRLPAGCPFNTSEVEVIKEGDQLTLRPRDKNWGAYFDARSRGHLPTRDQPNLDERLARTTC
ncbi:MAG: AbrB/MazE/SpoVT family DNA-binding domain-containing protein [Gammaproteobacteria bacterium]|nr:AbrB/MazE/SpoVT family DNA-binding domain-containing protein [Gammaproteobacteria bacterium]MDE0273367.1 AbrB/MazE/SpoVT family DNA-binding domain-containing protein [Gammaproteobacteria bacterium]